MSGDEQLIASLAAIKNHIIGLILIAPELGVCLDRACKEIDLAARIITGEVELDACSGCGCTVEDGECPSGGVC